MNLSPYLVRLFLLFIIFPFSICSLAQISVFVNEFHYDNTGTDVGEFIEIAGPAGTDLSMWSLSLYNGATGNLYQTLMLSGVIGDEGNGLGTLSFQVPGLMNGFPDGFALANPSTIVVQFLSYEGAFMALDGPAMSMMSTDIGVFEPNTTPLNQSLQLEGIGTEYEDFTWSGPLAASPGAINTNQIISNSISIIVNELDADDSGTDDMEFIELYDGGVGNVLLNGLVLVFYNGATDMSYQSFDLDGYSTDINGYFVLGNAAVPGVDLVFPGDVLQNGADAAGLFRGNSSDFPNGSGLTASRLVDAIVYDTGDADDAGLLILLNAGQPQVDEGGIGFKDIHSLQRIPNGSGGLRNTNTYIPAPPTPGMENRIPPKDIIINEVDYDQPGTDTAEFIELKNITALPVNLGNYELVLVNGTGGGAVTYNTIILPNINLAPGAYFVICTDAAGTPNCDLDVSPDIDLIQNGSPDAVGLRTNGFIVDVVSYEGITGGIYTEGSGMGLEDPSSEDFTGLSRIPDGNDTDQNNQDFVVSCISPGLPNTAQDVNCLPINNGALVCQTELPTTPELDSLLARHQRFREEYASGIGIHSFDGLRIIPVQFHIVTLDDGTGGVLEADILNELSIVNMRYQGAGLIFVACDAAKSINSTAFYDIIGYDEADNLSATYNDPNVLNIFFVGSALNDAMNGACGWATFSSDTDEYVLISNNCATNTSTLAHEIGHYFDLFHTHETAFGNELANGSNCVDTGDKMCSTPADPNLSMKVDGMCNYTGMDLDANMDPYIPDPTNIMSYSTKPCRDNFTVEQLAKVAFTAINYRNFVSIITCPVDMLVYLDANCQFIVPDYRNMITANAACTLVDTVQIPAPGTIISGVGSTEVSITVTDANMDFSSCSFMVTHLDNTPPQFTPIDDDTIFTNSLCEAFLPDYRDSTTITDNCDVNPVVSQVPSPGSNIGGVGTTQMVYVIAMDVNGNRDSIGLLVTVADPNPDLRLNCRSINASLDENGNVNFQLLEIVPGANCSDLLDVKVETEYGVVVFQDFNLLRSNYISFQACRYLGSSLKVTVSDKIGSSCWSYVTLKQINGPIFLRGRSITVFCLDTLVLEGDILNVKPIANIPCQGMADVQFVADWIQPFDCASDTAKIILREYEAFDKLGRRASVLDTIVVLKLPQIVNIDLGANFRNIGCSEIDTLYCGENTLTDLNTGYTPVGPYLLIEEFPGNPAVDLDGDMVNCDTLYFCAFKDGELVSLYENSAKCGIQVHKDIWAFGDRCERNYKVVIDIKQTCSKTPVMLDCMVPGSDQQIEAISNGYYRCEFWITDLDTIPPLFAAKVFGEFNCLTIDTSFLSGSGFSFLDVFQPVVSTDEHSCEAHTYLPPLCVYDDWSGIKMAKATVEGGGTYILENEKEECFLLEFDGGTLTLEDYISLFGESIDEVLTDSIIDLLTILGVLEKGFCYRSHEKIKLPKSDKPIRIFYEVYDSCHLIGRDTAYIKVKDYTPPVPVVDKGITVSLSDKKTWVDAEVFDEGSWDNCEVITVLARRADWKEFQVDFCSNDVDSQDCENAEKESALCWIWTDGHDTLWMPILEDDKHCDEIEAFYGKQLDWFCSDDFTCGPLLYNSWLYDLIKYATITCKSGGILDDHGFEKLLQRALGEPMQGDQIKVTNEDFLHFLDTVGGGGLKEIFLKDGNIFELDTSLLSFFFYGVDVFKCQPIDIAVCEERTEEALFQLQLEFLDYQCSFLSVLIPSLDIDIFLPGILSETSRNQIFDEWKAIGGGWSDAVPFSCKDACSPVTVEILVMDYWCNWSKAWTDVWVEDKTPVSVVKDVEDAEISCKTYKDRRYADPKGGIHPVSIERIVELAKAGDDDAYDALDGIFGGYCKAWLDPYGNWVDKAGEEIECDIPFSDSTCECSSWYDLEQVYDEHLGYKWDSVYVDSCWYYERPDTFTKGIVIVNCEENVYCEQDVWCEFDHCGQGYLFRKFKIWQGCPPHGDRPDSLAAHIPDTIYRHQRIWVGINCELEKKMFDVPGDAEVFSCGIEYDPDGSGNVVGVAGPENTGMPTLKDVFDRDCRIVGIAHHDKVFKVVGGNEACYKIIRTWYFADWCGEKPTEALWWRNRDLVQDSCIQKIIVRDTVPPECVMNGPVENGDTITAPDCYYNFEATVSVTDTCGVIKYTWEVINISKEPHERMDGSSDALSGGDEDFFTITVDDLGPGTYKVKVRVTDECQNESYCDYTFTIVSEKKPTPICITMLTAVLNPMDRDQDGVIDTAMATVWASEFNSSSTPACQDTALEYRLELVDGVDDDSWEEDADSLVVGCANFGSKLVRLWVISQPSGSVDYCDVALIVQTDFVGCIGPPNPDSPLKGDMEFETGAQDESRGGNSKPTIENRGLPMGTGGDAFRLYQNQPNPFKEETSIGFYLTKTGDAALIIFDMTGKVLKVVEGYYPKGNHDIRIRAQDLGVNGVLYYQLDTDLYSATRKMIVIK